jgi:hypothetical protein
MGYDENSPAQRPEKLYQQKGFIAYLGFVVVLVIALMLIDIPFLEVFQQ